MLRFLGPDDLDALVAAFNDAFSDYLVPMHVTAPQLREICTRRGNCSRSRFRRCASAARDKWCWRCWSRTSARWRSIARLASK